MTAGVPFPPNPPEQTPRGWPANEMPTRDDLVAEARAMWSRQLADDGNPYDPEHDPLSHRGFVAGFAAADSWWRSRLVSDETVEAVGKVIAGPAKCCCDDDWRLPPSRVCPVHGEGSWPYQSHYAKASAVLAALLPVAESEIR